jgi:cytochrome c
MRVLLLLLLLLLCLAPAQAESPLRHGRALARELCAPCHAIGRHGESPRAGAPPLRTISRDYDLDELPRQLMRGLLPAHPDMPEFRFKPGDVRALRDYLRSIQG